MGQGSGELRATVIGSALVFVGCTSLLDIDGFEYGADGGGGTSASGGNAAVTTSTAVVSTTTATGGASASSTSTVAASGGGGGPVSCPLEDPATGHCYAYFDANQVTWGDGRALCQGLGQGWDLAAISSEPERDFIDGNYSNNSAWLGARDVTSMDVFEWVNGEMWGYAPWEMGDPNGGAEDCVSLMPVPGPANDEFRDDACDETSWPLCERPSN